MTHDSEDAAKDLAFLRALVSEGPKAQETAGTIFLAAGLIYGLDCLAYWAQMAFAVPLAPFMWPVLAIAPVVAFLAVIVWVVVRDRKHRTQGVATRALNAAYLSAGLANLVLIIVFGYVAASEKSMLIWLLYPAVMCAFLGAVWYVAWMIRKTAWMALVCAGWLAVAIALGLLIHHVDTYLLVLGVALIVLMGGSGQAMRRNAGRHQP